MKRDHSVIVGEVTPGSIADEAGIERGDRIKSINREKIRDIFDYKFLITNEELLLEVEKKNGEIWEIEIEKDEYEDIGVEFENPMLDEASSCTNKCVFCFIDQLPKGFRDTLYFKDDDSRLSFLNGNYVTLTNVSRDEIERIIRYRMSPINVSVHTTNPELRVRMLQNRFAGDVLEKIKALVEGGIAVNCQIVLCRGINDGAELDRTLKELTLLCPPVNSISVVPVGLTKYRDGLAKLKPYDKESSLKVIRQVEEWQDVFLKRFGSRIVYIADEFYIMAGEELPGYEEYEDFPQLENGVGLVAMLRQEFYDYVSGLESGRVPDRNISIATGVSACKFIKELAECVEKKFKGVRINVYQIKNEFFGENVTVTGLLTGRDILEQLDGRELGDELLICRCMLKSGEDVFLDDFTVSDLQKGLNVKVTAVENSGKDFVDKALGKG